ncbi:GNAT family N-acetyltransferase [Tropicimonas sp. IMCC34011]|uniref:GNAT family N-acetyltransferase n=1 Tax=Tropicimonas sp. IMCC34011 TaxID=2248759 RepID=UPI000E23359F|nr:GNAT family N-acetyltransferase [Tropicimonas sp. IMCC34011]
MTTRLHLCGPDDLARLLPMVAAHHEELGVKGDEESRTGSLFPLLNGSPHGAVYLVGPKNAPVGYASLSFGWSLRWGGISGRFDELYIRKAVRGRGMDTEALAALIPALKEAGLVSLAITAIEGSREALDWNRLGFRSEEGALRLVRRL